METSNLQIDQERFKVKTFNHITHPSVTFQSRLNSLRHFILPQLPEPIIQEISDLTNEKVSLVGIVSKVLNDNTKIFLNYSSPSGDDRSNTIINLYGAEETDLIYLEDQTGKILLKGSINPINFVNGLIIGVSGIYHFEEAFFEVENIYFPYIPPDSSNSFQKVPCLIGFISDIALNSLYFDYPLFMKNFRSIPPLSLLVVIGNIFDFSSSNLQSSPENAVEEWKSQIEIIEAQPISIMNEIFHECNFPVILIPGLKDLVDGYFPIQPFQSVLIEKENSHIISTTNPAKFSFENIKFLVMSGEPIEDIEKCTNMDYENCKQSLILWRHFAPTAITNYGGVVSYDNDLLVIDEIPDIFVTGNAPELSLSNFHDIMLLSIPNYQKSQMMTVLNLQNLEVIKIQE